MKSGPENYLESLKLIAESRTIGADDLSPFELALLAVLEAQARATLALAAATAMAEGGHMPGADFDAWAEAAGVAASARRTA